MSQAQHQSFHFPDFPRRRARAKRFSTQRDFPSSDGFFLFYDEDSRGAKHGDALSSLILHTSFSNLFAITNGRFAFGLFRIWPLMALFVVISQPLIDNDFQRRCNRKYRNLRPRLKHFTAIIIQLNLYTAPLKPYYFFVKKAWLRHLISRDKSISGNFLIITSLIIWIEISVEALLYLIALRFVHSRNKLKVFFSNSTVIEKSWYLITLIEVWFW